MSSEQHYVYQTFNLVAGYFFQINVKIEKENIKRKPFIVNTYYKRIVSTINSEIEYVTSLINHAATKGQANEEILKNLLIKFLPKKSLKCQAIRQD